MATGGNRFAPELGKGKVKVHVIQRRKFLYSQREYSPRKPTVRSSKKNVRDFLTTMKYNNNNNKFISLTSPIKVH